MHAVVAAMRPDVQIATGKPALPTQRGQPRGVVPNIYARALLDRGLVAIGRRQDFVAGSL